MKKNLLTMLIASLFMSVSAISMANPQGNQTQLYESTITPNPNTPHVPARASTTDLEGNQTQLVESTITPNPNTPHVPVRASTTDLEGNQADPAGHQTEGRK